MIWRVEFNPDSSYILSSSYGMPHQGTTGIIGGGQEIHLRGKWSFTRGTKSDPEAAVLELSVEKQQESVRFLVLSDDILHLLDSDRNLMVGNGGWSYTLNRTNGAVSGSSPGVSSVKYSSFLGTYEGRTPCVDFLLEFTEVPSTPACTRIKWRLYLYQDPHTGSPTTYQFNGTEAGFNGTWETIQGTDPHPKAIVYQLNKEGSEPLYFLRADENTLFILGPDRTPLVGDRLFSFTLSRTE
jgi:hypothetical protein